MRKPIPDIKFEKPITSRKQMLERKQEYQRRLAPKMFWNPRWGTLNYKILGIVK